MSDEQRARDRYTQRTDRPGHHDPAWEGLSDEMRAEFIRREEAAGGDPNPAIVPGMMRCAKCNFVLVHSTLYMKSGTVGAGSNETEPCPNGCGPLWPMTWQQQASDLEERCIEQMERAKTAEAKVVDLQAAVVALDNILCSPPTNQAERFAARKALISARALLGNKP